MKQYYTIKTDGRSAEIYIHDDIARPDATKGARSLAPDIAGLDTDTITVYINTLGGDVAESLAVYNALRAHPARVRTVCTGFACSGGGIMFMGGDERVMYDASLLMIHNAWSSARGNADELRKTADDLEVITETAANAYISGVSISRDELRRLMDAETWIKPADALRMGFATSIVGVPSTGAAAASARDALMRLVDAGIKVEAPESEPPEDERPTSAPEPDAPPDEPTPPDDTPKNKKPDYAAALAAFFMPNLKGEN